MQGFRRMVNAAIGDELILEHLIVDLDAGEMRKERPACQDMVEHLRTSVMQHSEAPVGRQRPLHRG